MNKLKMAASALGVFAGLGGASHELGEMLRGNVAPADVMIEAWPSLTVLNGEPAMTVVPSFLVAGVLTIVIGLLVAAWAGKYMESSMGGLVLILLSIVLLLVGGGIVPPFFGIAGGFLVVFISAMMSIRNRS